LNRAFIGGKLIRKIAKFKLKILLPSGEKVGRGAARMRGLCRAR